MPIAFLLKTKTYVKSLRKIGQKHKKFWNFFGYASIPVGFVGLILALGFLIFELVRILTTPSPAAGISLVLPGVRIPGSSIFIPFWYGIIALFIVLVVHEGAHGVVAESWGLKLKSAGVGMFTFLPFAFVEPDEKKLQKIKPKIQLSIFAAGPFANIIVALLAVLISSFVLVPISSQALEPTGIFIDSLESGLPAQSAGLLPGTVITQVDTQTITTAEEFMEYMSKVIPGDKVTLYSDDNSFEITTIQNPTNASKAYLGIKFRQDTAIKPELKQIYGNIPLLLIYATRLFYWIFILNIGIGMVNLLPLGPIDGGRMTKLALEAIFKNKKLQTKLYAFLSTLSLSLLLLNVIAPYFLSLNF